MKRPEEISKGLYCCAHPVRCFECPYHPHDRRDVSGMCQTEMMDDARNAIQALIAERDALLVEVQKVRPCMLCAHHDNCPHKFMGAKRADGKGYSKKGCWVYRGAVVVGDG